MDWKHAKLVGDDAGGGGGDGGDSGDGGGGCV